MRRMRLAWLLAALICGCATAQPARPAQHAPDDTNQDWRASDDTLSLTMRAIAGQLSGAGLTPARDTFRGFLTAGARATHGVELQANSCVTLIAIASRGVHD